MANYGYSRTSYGAGGGEDGGGFMGGSQQGSQSEKKYSEESLRPVTIKQLVDCEEAYPGADLTIDGQNITMVTVVGQVRQVSPQATNITYRIDDGTATMDVKKWIDAERQDEADPQFQPDQYVRVMGRLKPFSGKKHLGAHFMRAVADFNEVNYHLLEATYVHLALTKGLPANGAAGAGAGAGGDAGGGDAMFVDSYASNPSAKLASCTPDARKMYNYMMNSPNGSSGVHMNEVAGALRMKIRDIKNAANELIQQAVIYTTDDDETWAILDY